MTDRERFLNLMDHKPVDRCVYGIWCSNAWPETVERWKKEGYDPDNPPDFNTDKWLAFGGWFFPSPPFERKVIEEDEKTVVYVNHEGITMKERKDNPYSSMPQFIRFPVESREEYRKFYSERFNANLTARIGSDYIEKLTGFRNRTSPLVVIADRWGGFFGGLRALVGVERLCMLFYDDPAWVEEMMDGVADFTIKMMDEILKYTDVDVFGFWEDMAYKTGPLIGPGLFRRFALPRYKRVVDFLKSRGVPYFCLDSDGDVSSLIPIWLDAGINTLYPFEVQAGMDVVKVRKKYGRNLRLWYGIDKRALIAGREAIDRELDRVRPLIEEGGYVPGLDHSMSPDVPYANYLYFMEALKKVCERG